MGTFCDEFLGKILLCADYRECKQLNTILMDVEDVYDYCSSKSNFTFDGVLKAVYDSALNDLTTLYREACELIESYKSGTFTEDEIPLLREALDFLNPREDLHIGNDSSDGVYLELDYWDLYALTVDTLLEDMGKKDLFKSFATSYVKEFYGGKNVPDKFKPILA